VKVSSEVSRVNLEGNSLGKFSKDNLQGKSLGKIPRENPQGKSPVAEELIRTHDL